MTKMSETQRIAILDFHNGVTDKRYTMLVRSRRTLDVMVANGWAVRVTAHTGNVTTAGLVAAGVDMDAIHAEALAEHADRLGILDEPISMRARTFALAVYATADGTYRAALDVLHEQAARDRYAAVLDFNLPMGADMTLVTGEAAPAPMLAEKRFADMTHGELRTLIRKLGQPVGDCTWNQLAVLAERAEAQGLVVQPDEAVPALTLADETPEQRVARHALDKPLIEAFDALRASAPTLASDVAALRAEIEGLWIGTDGIYRTEVEAILDRIAGAVPRRAVAANGVPLYQHECDYVEQFTEAPDHGGCDACESGSNNPGDWRALYTLGGE